MKYYKIIIDTTIKNVASSNDFKVYFSKHKNLLDATEKNGEYILKNGFLYHAEWMMQPQGNLNYLFAEVKEISLQEYNDLSQALISTESPESLEILQEPQILITSTSPSPNVPDIYEIYTLDFVREKKLKELSAACNQTIENGIDVNMSDGKTHHFSLTTQDQLNLISLQAMVDQGQELIPYHADGELCKFYSSTDIHKIITAAAQFKTYHTTYYNALKNYVQSLDDIHTISEIKYGIELPEEYQTDVLKTLL